jgi:hypothetical protein
MAWKRFLMPGISLVTSRSTLKSRKTERKHRLADERSVCQKKKTESDLPHLDYWYGTFHVQRGKFTEISSNIYNTSLEP